MALAAYGKVVALMSTIQKLQENLGHQFQDENLLLTALTHRSFGSDNNERLEFLGDSVLSVLISDEVYRRFAQAKEGHLSRMRAALVNGEMLAQIANELGINEHLRLGPGEEKSGGQYRESILADALEAIIGAVYLDSNLDKCRQLVIPWFAKYLKSAKKLLAVKDAKSRLQEWMQAHKFPLPNYEVVEIKGEQHAQIFCVSCSVDGLPHKSFGESSNRRKAEQQAAENYLDLL